jgi:hypothetical protein
LVEFSLKWLKLSFSGIEKEGEIKPCYGNMKRITLYFENLSLRPMKWPQSAIFSTLEVQKWKMGV